MVAKKLPPGVILGVLDMYERYSSLLAMVQVAGSQNAVYRKLDLTVRRLNSECEFTSEGCFCGGGCAGPRRLLGENPGRKEVR